jgi:hypothetical protein
VIRLTAARIGAVVGVAAVLGAGYAAGGTSGLIDAAAVAAVGILIVARGTIRGPAPVRPQKTPHRPPAVRTEDFPAFRRFASDLEWAQLSQRHYEHVLRPQLARLAAALSRPADLTGPRAGETDGPGVDLATLDRILTTLEGS